MVFLRWPFDCTGKAVMKGPDRSMLKFSAFCSQQMRKFNCLMAMLVLQAFRGFAGTSVLIMVGVATDTTRRLRAEKAMTQYGDMDRFYESGVSTDDIEN